MTFWNAARTRSEDMFGTKGKNILLGTKLARLALAGALTPMLASCRSFEASRCSAPEVVDTVKSLSEGGDNPVAAALLKTANITISLDAIRTVSSSSGETFCEGRLTIKHPVPGRLPQEGPAPPETADHRALREQIEQQLPTKVSEVTYKLERTDDGRIYVTIIPSEADTLDQQNRQQRDQDLRDEQEQRQQRQFERDDQRFEQEQKRR